VTVTVCRAEGKDGGKKGDEKSAFAERRRRMATKKSDQKSAFAAAGGASGVKKGDSHRLQRGGKEWRQKR
jgi:hypothetical protein